MKVQAYLGVNKPETLAEGEVETNLGELQFAVVKFGREQDPETLGQFVGAYTHYGPAVSAVNQHTTHKHYAVLCQLRPAPVPASAHVGAGK